MSQRTARDATDEELIAILVQVEPYLEARGGQADPTDALVILAVKQEARERGLIT
jgi:hypothetical protein